MFNAWMSIIVWELRGRGRPIRQKTLINHKQYPFKSKKTLSYAYTLTSLCLMPCLIKSKLELQAVCASSRHWCNVLWCHTGVLTICNPSVVFFTPTPKEAFSKGFTEELSPWFSLHTCLLHWHFCFTCSPAQAAEVLLGTSPLPPTLLQCLLPTHPTRKSP